MAVAALAGYSLVKQKPARLPWHWGSWSSFLPREVERKVNAKPLLERGFHKLSNYPDACSAIPSSRRGPFLRFLFPSRGPLWSSMRGEGGTQAAGIFYVLGICCLRQSFPMGHVESIFTLTRHCHANFICFLAIDGNIPRHSKYLTFENYFIVCSDTFFRFFSDDANLRCWSLRSTSDVGRTRIDRSQSEPCGAWHISWGTSHLEGRIIRKKRSLIEYIRRNFLFQKFIRLLGTLHRDTFTLTFMRHHLEKRHELT